MFDGSALPFQQNLAKSLEVYKLTEAAGIGLEAEMGAIGGVEDDKFVAEDKALLANFDDCVRLLQGDAEARGLRAGDRHRAWLLQGRAQDCL